MEKCIKCGGTLPAGAKLCPYCGNPVSYYEEKMQPVPPAPTKKTRGRTILIVAVSVLSVLLIASLAFALMLWTTSTGASPKLGVSPGSLDFGTLQVGSQSSQVLTLSNSGKQDLNWNADKGAANWLTLDPSQGRIPSMGSQTIYVRADTAQLTAGRYSASISFTSNGGGASVSAVLIVATGQPSQGAPVVSGISPTSGPAAGGTTVTIRGSGFTGANQVLFGTATSTFTVNSDTQITVVSPAGSGTVHVTVITPKGTSAASSADQFTYQGAQPIPPIPTIASISPTSGPTTGGMKVTITGTGFTGVSKVLFGTTAASFTVNTDKQITAVSPAGSGTVDVRVITPGGTSNAARFNYYVPGPPPAHVPFIKSISPPSGPVAGGTKVTITGTDLSGVSKVMFGTVPASSFTPVSTTQITAVSPAVKNSGTVDVTVTTRGGTSKISNADRFTYVLAPTIKSILPTSGPAAGGSTVTITGSGLTGASKVLFGSVPASFKLTSDTQITAVSPAGSGTVDVKVTTPGGTSATSSADRFTYVPTPIVTAVSPTSGSAAGGTSVIITGSNFTGASKVLFGSVPASFKLTSDIQITAISPAGSGTVDVQVTTLGGSSVITGADHFTYVFAEPKIASISPISGPAAGGSTVTITGSGFTGTSKVLFGTVPASSFKLISDTQITAVSPAGSGTVDVQVTTPGGTSNISNADQFTYLSPPVANAGADQTVAVNSTVTLDGSGSSDPGGKPLTYEWTQIDGPSVTLSSSMGVNPTFTAPASATSLTFQLVVNNGQTDSSPARVTITIK